MYTPQFAKPKILTVSQVNFYLKSIIENDPNMNFVFLTGEISNLTDHYRSGHIYLSLKDERSVIRAVMFSGNARNLKFKPQDGMKVICRGRIAVYEPSGQYQLYIEDMQPDGIGALTLAFEQLKDNLSAKGLFDSSHKKNLPKFPKTVGVITSPTGAAVQDIINIIKRRFPVAKILIAPVLVQGENAPKQLINAVNYFSKSQIADVVIIGRGGGSIEDLWAFNDEMLAYAIYDCKIPIISAVGHETDFTICDFVADVRASTPSAAAEIAVPDRQELLVYYKTQYQYLNELIEKKFKFYENKYKFAEQVISEFSPQNVYLKNVQILKEKQQRLKNAIEKNFLNEKSKKVIAYQSKIDGLNPLSVLSRGFSIVEKDGKMVSEKSQLNENDIISITFSDGKINAKICGE